MILLLFLRLWKLPRRVSPFQERERERDTHARGGCGVENTILTVKDKSPHDFCGEIRLHVVDLEMRMRFHLICSFVQRFQFFDFFSFCERETGSEREEDFFLSLFLLLIFTISVTSRNPFLNNWDKVHDKRRKQKDANRTKHVRVRRVEMVG